MSKKQSIWYVYIVSCSDKTLYTGITTDLNRRITEHNSRYKGAKYTRGRQPVKLVYFEEYNSRSHASRREVSIKKLTSVQKQTLILNISTSLTS